MPATLKDIDAALYAALAALQTDPGVAPTDAKPFALVARFDGEFAPEQLAEFGAQYPLCALRWDDEASAREVDTIGPDSEDVARSGWTVLVAVEDPRAVDDALVGASGALGLFDLVSKVVGACNALYVSAGLWRGRAVRYVRTTRVPALTRKGVAYARAVTFEARRVAEDAADPVVSTQDLLGVDGDVNLIPAQDAAPDPMAEFKTDA